MKDRVPIYPGRVRLTPVAGQADTFDMVRADGAVEEGTAIGKGTLLTDATAEAIGMDPAKDPTVDQAFLALLLSSKEGCLLRITVTCGGAPAKSGIPILGATTVQGAPLATTGYGTFLGFTNAASTTLTMPAYLDMAAVSKIVSTPTGTIVDITLELPKPTAGTKVFSSSGEFQFSPYATSMDICCVGGGGGGAGGDGSGGGGGGGGGYVTNNFDLAIVPNNAYTVTIGAGGAGINYTSSGARAGAGGMSMVTGPFGTVSAAGGSGGTCPVGGGEDDRVPGYGGNGNGRGAGPYSAASRGGDGTVRRFGEETGILYSGGGGTGGAVSDSPGGASYGGTGYAKWRTDGQSGTGPGGGGGGASYGDGERYGGGGYRGEVAVRWRISK